MPAAVDFRILGPLLVTRGETPLAIGPGKPRELLSLLIINAPGAVSRDRIVEDLWGGAAPASARKGVQVYVSGLRKALGDGLLVTRNGGYALEVGAEAIDAEVFECRVSDARAARRHGDARRAAELYRSALGLWRGPALSDAASAPFAHGAIRRLDEQRLLAIEERIEADLQLGRHREVIVELEALVADQPLRERAWGHLMLALYRCGRQADALEAYQRARAGLVEALGLEPDEELRRLQQQILVQDAALAPARAILPSAPGSALLERERELAELAAACQAAARGDGSVVSIHGAPGIGKTALLGAFRRSLEASDIVLTARGSELERENAHGVVRQLLEPALRRYGEALLEGPAAPARELLEPVAGPVTHPTPGFEALHALYWLVANLAERGRVVLCVDDAQWCDPDSQRFLSYLATRLEGMSALLVLAHRTGSEMPQDLSEVADRFARRIAPPPLSAGATAALVRERLGEASSADLCDACHEATLGNPFMVRELVDELDRHDGAASDPQSVRALAPPTIVRAIGRRLDALDDHARALAHAAAILGPGARHGFAARLAGLTPDAAAAAAAALARSGLTTGGPAVMFVHPLVLAAARENVSPTERSALHRAAARLLHEEAGDVEQAATHLLAVTPAGDPWAIGILRRAADIALARAAPQAAVALLRRALAEPPPAAERAEVALELAEAAYSVGEPDLLELTEQALVLQSDPALRLRAAVNRGHVLCLIGRAREAAQVVESALLAGALPPDQRGAAEGLVLIWGVASLDARAVSGHRVAEVVRATEAMGDGAPAVLLSLAGIERVMSDGTAESASALARRGWARVHEVPTGNPFRTMLGLALALSGHLAEAQAELTRVAAMGGAAFHGVEAYAALATRAWIRLLRGDLAGAEADAANADELVSPGMRVEILTPLTASARASALTARGLLDEAMQALYTAPQMATARGMGMAAPWWAARARLRLAQGQPEAALEDAESMAHWAARFPARHSGWCAPDAIAAEVHAELGDGPRARTHATAALQAAQAFGGPLQLGVALRATALATESAGERARRLEQALDHFRAADAGLWAARVSLELGRALVELGRDGELPLRAALEWAVAAGAHPLLEAAGETLAALGGDVPPLESPAAEPLTPAEHRAVELAQAGLTPREIAERLTVTPSLVERRLASAGRKLGGVRPSAELSPRAR